MKEFFLNPFVFLTIMGMLVCALLCIGEYLLKLERIKGNKQKEERKKIADKEEQPQSIMSEDVECVYWRMLTELRGSISSKDAVGQLLIEQAQNVWDNTHKGA